MATSGEPWMEYLNEDECWYLLSLHPVGRIGVLVDGAPEVYPVNFTVDSTSIVFRTDPGNMLRSVCDGRPVCFEVDGLDFTGETGWSVLVKGSGSEIAAESVDAGVRERLRIWSVGEKAHWVRIGTREITGRRLNRTSPGHRPTPPGAGPIPEDEAPAPPPDQPPGPAPGPPRDQR